MSGQAIDFIRRLICDPKERLGINGINEIKFHPFFQGVDWKNLRKKTPPFIPKVSFINKLKDELDTSNFDPFQEDPDDPWYPKQKIHNPIKKIVLFYIIPL